jgi:hypothetical protein
MIHVELNAAAGTSADRPRTFNKVSTLFFQHNLFSVDVQLTSVASLCSPNLNLKIKSTCNLTNGLLNLHKKLVFQGLLCYCSLILSI